MAQLPTDDARGLATGQARVSSVSLSKEQRISAPEAVSWALPRLPPPASTTALLLTGLCSGSAAPRPV